MTGYGQYCPMAKAMEVLDERWTLLVVRELLLGSTHFNELRRGVPKMSPALLSKRLRTLERAGIVQRRGGGRQTSYHLTQAGAELHDVVMALNVWGVRWIGQLGREDLDPHLLFWDIQRTVPIDVWPRRRTVLEFRLTDVEPVAAHWWLVVADGRADVCDFDPGYPIEAWVESELGTLTRIWRGDRAWAEAIASGLVTITGTAEARRRVPQWLGQGTIALLPRRRPEYGQVVVPAR